MLIGHMVCVVIIVLKWQSVDGLLNVGAPMLPIAAYAVANLVRFSSQNKLYKDDSDNALFLFAVVSISFPLVINLSCIFVILAVDSNFFSVGFSVDDGRELITWLEVSLGAGYAIVVEGLFRSTERE